MLCSSVGTIVQAGGALCRLFSSCTADLTCAVFVFMVIRLLFSICKLSIKRTYLSSNVSFCLIGARGFVMTIFH